MMKTLTFNTFLAFLLIFLTPLAESCQRDDAPEELAPLVMSGIPFSPGQYICRYTSIPPVIDGMPGEEVWNLAAWSRDFQDIEGNRQPAPEFRTRVKMLWDDSALYVAAQMEEPHVWATLRQRDTIIFKDNDFEIFIDPDGDTHLYYELEINALGTCWDLLLTKPYRDGGTPVDAWDISGMRVATYIDGTLNNPDDTDRGWSLEVALPWKILEECAPGGKPPVRGDYWRMNFSRVEWETDVLDGHYVKKIGTMSGKPLPEKNWVWSPQGIINMHAPEMWGYVFFGGAGDTTFQIPEQEEIKWLLRNIYYHQVRYFRENHRYAGSLKELGVSAEAFDPWKVLPVFYVTPSLFEINYTPAHAGYTIHIRQDGKTWETKPVNPK